MHRIYYNFIWKPHPDKWVVYSDSFWDALPQHGEIRTSADGFNMLVPGDKFGDVRKVFEDNRVTFQLEQAPTSNSAWPLEQGESGRERIEPTITPAFLECAVCHDVLNGNAAQVGVHLSEHLREIIDANRLALP